MKNNKNPLVSILMLTYNHADYIKEALDGVLAQKTNFEFEVIVADDASTDGNIDIILDYAARYPQLVPSIQLKNSESFKNMHDALKKITGKYVAFCEGDDYWTDCCKLQKQIDFLEKNEDFNVCCHKVKVQYHDSQLYHTSLFIPKRKFNFSGREEGVLYADEVIHDYLIHTSSVVCRWKFPEGPPENWHRHMGWDHFLLLLHADCSKIRYFDETMSVWRRYPGSFSWEQNVDVTAFFKQKGDYWIDVYEFMDTYFNKRYTLQIHERIMLALRSMTLYAVKQQDWKTVDEIVEKHQEYFTDFHKDRLLLLSSRKVNKFPFFIAPYPQWIFPLKDKFFFAKTSGRNAVAKFKQTCKRALARTMLVRPESLGEFEENFKAFDLPKYAGAARWKIIVSNPRSGGIVLSTMLAQTGKAGLPLEYLNPLYINDWMLRFGHMEPDEHMRCLEKHRTSPNGNFGINIHFNQLRGYADLLPSDAQFVWLRRIRKLDQAISYFKARLSNQWSAKSKPTRILTEQDYDFWHIYRLVLYCIKEDIEWEKYFKSKNFAYLPLTFEDVRKDYEGSCRRALNYFEIDSQNVPQLPDAVSPQRDNLSKVFTEKYLHDARRHNVQLHDDWYSL